MQNAPELGVFFQSEEYACMPYEIRFMRIFHKVKDIGTEYVTYWYQFFTCFEILRGEIFSTLDISPSGPGALCAFSPSNSLATNFRSTVMFPMGENGLALF